MWAIFRMRLGRWRRCTRAVALAAACLAASVAANAAAPVPPARVALHGVAVGGAGASPAIPGGTRYVFQPGPDPTIVLQPPQGAWDWRGQGALELPVQDLMPWAVTLVVEIDGAKPGEALHATVGVPAGPQQTLVVPLHATSPLAFGMQAGPPMPFDDAGRRTLVATTVTGTLDPAAVRAVRLSMPAPQAAQTVALGTVATDPEDTALRAAYAGIVDRYGQYTRAAWPEKIATDAALRAAVLAPARAADGTAPADRYGGLAVPLARTGWFHAQRADGRWWLVTPDGHGFFSLGVNTVAPDVDRTYVTGREAMFDGLPPDTGATAAFWGTGDSRNAQQGAGQGRCCDHGRWFDFYAANLARVDGPDWPAAWRTRTLARLAAWGFNTVGNWSDPALGALHRLPYTRALRIDGVFGNVATGYDYWGRMPDPFDPRFAVAADAAAVAASRGVRDDPWLLGYFAGNELAWAAPGPEGRWALALGTLHGEARSPAKQAFIRMLQQQYGTAAKLSAAWGIALASWQALDATNFPAPLPSEAHPAIAQDYGAWLTRYADRYFRIVAAAIHRADPHHLFLGVRFAQATPEAITACAHWCDVVSFNAYADVPQHGYDAPLMRKLDKPVLITEFDFASNDRGPFGTAVVPVWNEAQRGAAYARYVAAAAADPDIVGVHWFEYVDEPVTGRLLDGENSHVGLVGITDIPFHGFVMAVRAANAAARVALTRTAAATPGH